MTKERNYENKGTKGIWALIDEIEGVRCLSVWEDPTNGQYHTVIMTNRIGLEMVVSEIQTVLRYKKNLEIRSQNIYFAKRLQEIQTLTARVKLLHFNESTSENCYNVNVVLTFLGEEARGSAQGGGALDRISKLKIAGEATLDAVKKLMPGSYEMPLRDIRPVDVNKGEIIITLVTLHHEGEIDRCGAALNREKDCESAIRSTLDAINRYLDRIMRE